MNVGFYYHSGTVIDGTTVAFPSHLAMFVEGVAQRAGSVVFYGHSGERRPIEDRTLQAPLVRPVSLGPRRSFPARTFFPQPALRRFDPARDGVDVLLIRGPTPLLPHLAAAASCPVALLLVGDYRDSMQMNAAPRWRRLAMAGWVRVYAHQQKIAGRYALVLTNSARLTRAADPSWQRVQEVFTSSLSEGALEEEPEAPLWGDGKGSSEPIRLLFAGRIVEEKGLSEAVEALALLRTRGWNVELELVGWSDEQGFPGRLMEQASGLGVADRLTLVGYRPAGPELMGAYRACDIFVIPSRTEGFPRAIVEALAAGRPVVASRVGGISDRLNDATAVLVPPRAPDELAAAIERLISEPDLREALVREGRRWASSFTNDRSCDLVVEALRTWLIEATSPSGGREGPGGTL